MGPIVSFVLVGGASWLLLKGARAKPSTMSPLVVDSTPEAGESPVAGAPVPKDEPTAPKSPCSNCAPAPSLMVQGATGAAPAPAGETPTDAKTAIIAATAPTVSRTTSTTLSSTPVDDGVSLQEVRRTLSTYSTAKLYY